jgi:hypothetical protein
MSHFALTCRLAALLILAAGLGMAACGQVPDAPPAGEKEKPTADNHTLSGPFTHENLSIFLVLGEDRIKGKSFLTLPEALAQKKVIVHETQQVNELAIENVSDKEEVFVQSGDILKGGQQDRIIAHDLIVPPKSGKLPLASFCVEAGRWKARGHESAISFNSAGQSAPTSGLKIAARKNMNQREVWEEVSKAQMSLGGRLGTDVRGAASPTSLQLTLENKKLQETTAAFVKSLTPIVEGKANVIGYVSVVNGQITSADVYAAHSLFVKSWPSLLHGSVVEALSAADKAKKGSPITLDQVRAFLVEAEKGNTSAKNLDGRIRLVERETKGALLFESLDLAQPNAVPLRKSYLKK